MVSDENPLGPLSFPPFEGFAKREKTVKPSFYDLTRPDHFTIPGINFPCYAFENQADTEGFAQMANRAGFQVVGLPNYIVWHIDTEEKEGNLKGRPKKQENH